MKKLFGMKKGGNIRSRHRDREQYEDELLDFDEEEYEDDEYEDEYSDEDYEDEGYPEEDNYEDEVDEDYPEEDNYEDEADEEYFEDDDYRDGEAYEDEIVPPIPCVFSEYAGRPDYAVGYNIPGISADHLLSVQVQWNDKTKKLRISDEFRLLHSRYRIVDIVGTE